MAKSLVTALVLTVAAFAAGIFAPASAQTAPLRVGQVNLSFYTAASGVVLEVLDRLGQPADVTEASHPDIYARLRRGEVDMLIAAWLPNAHGPLHAPVKDAVVEAAILYEDAKLFWAVPAHVSPEVRSIRDLARPDVAARMDKTIIGVGPGSGLMRGSEEIMRRYGLSAAGYTLSVAPAPEWAGRLDRATAERLWMVMPLWQPQYLNLTNPVRILDDPEGVFGTDRAVVVVRTEAWQRLPARSREVIGRIRLDIQTVAELERAIVVDKRPAREVAREWMARNEARVAGWFAP